MLGRSKPQPRSLIDGLDPVSYVEVACRRQVLPVMRILTGMHGTKDKSGTADGKYERFGEPKRGVLIVALALQL